MKAIFLLSFLGMTSLCHAQAPSVTSQLRAAIKKQYADNAFRANLQVTLLEVTNVTYEMVGENALNRARMSRNRKARDRYMELEFKYKDLMTAYAQQVSLLRDVSESLAEDARQSAAAAERKSKLYRDSAQMTVVIDSLYESRIEARKVDQRIYYRAAFNLKATFSGQNIWDDFVMYFDKKYLYVPLD